MVIFPCTAKTREKGQKPAGENVVEGEMVQGWHCDTTKSIFQSVREKNVGLVTIKPFVGGFLFKSQAKFPVLGPGSKTEHDLARLVLQCILTNDAITAVVPGVTTVYEVDSAVRASSPQQVAITAGQRQWLARAADECWQRLPEHYAWLRDWEIV
jgi:predicted aldo/keto reductase-like oxidoreductase